LQARAEARRREETAERLQAQAAAQIRAQEVERQRSQEEARRMESEGLPKQAANGSTPAFHDEKPYKQVDAQPIKKRLGRMPSRSNVGPISD
jgi:hypothetical protein